MVSFCGPLHETNTSQFFTTTLHLILVHITKYFRKRNTENNSRANKLQNAAKNLLICGDNLTRFTQTDKQILLYLRSNFEMFFLSVPARRMRAR